MSIAAAILNHEAGEPEVAQLTDTGEAPAYEFDIDFQTKIVALQLRDTSFAARTDGLIEPTYFEHEIDRHIVKIAVDYFTVYKKTPDWGILGTLLKSLVFKKTIRADMLKEIVPRLNELKSIDISDRDYVVDQVATFARSMAMQNAMMKSIEALEKGDIGKIEKLMSEALQVGAQDDTGFYDYWKENDNRAQERVDKASGLIAPDGITTGVTELDEILQPHNGWGRKELNVLMGAAKAGKSMALGEFAKAASLAGYNVLYMSCEVAAKIIAMRVDANVSDTAIKLLGAHPERVRKAIGTLSAKAGAFEIREYPTGTLTCSMVRRLLKTYRARGIVFDLIVADYADIMAPEHRSDVERENSKQVYESLRAIAFEENAAVLTATQSNRTGAKAITAKGTDVAEDFNKVRIADCFISINATDAERATGEARLFFANMRNTEDGFTLRIRQERDRMKFISKVLGRE